MNTETISLEVAIEVVLRNGPTFETIAGLCKMAVEAERESCAKVCDMYTDSGSDHEAGAALNIQEAIRARGMHD